jgi:hypothetical protein
LVLVRGGEAVLLRGATLDGKMKYWEIIGDNLSQAGWSWGCVSAIDSNGRTIWIAIALLTAFGLPKADRMTGYRKID